MLSCAASVACVAVTSIGVHRLGGASIIADDADFALDEDDTHSFSWSGRKGVDDGSVVTANIFVTAMAELAWSAISIHVAYRGARYVIG